MYTSLREVVCPGTDGCQGRGWFSYKEFNEIPLSELRRSAAAFANNRRLAQEFERAELVRRTFLCISFTVVKSRDCIVRSWFKMAMYSADSPTMLSQ